MRIDSQQHFTTRYTPEILASILERNRFDGSIAVAAEDTGRMLATAAEHDYIRGVVGPLVMERLDEWQRNPKFRGVWTRVVPEDVEELERRGLSLDFEGDAAGALRIAERAPGLRMIVPYLAPGVVQLVEAPKVFVRISGMIAPAKAQVQELLGAFGPRRLMFGSDWPAALPEHAWKEHLAYFTQSLGAQTIETREELLGGTATRAYELA